MKLKIVSSNIRFETPEDKENNWPNRKEFLSMNINSFNPAILGTQEGRIDQIKSLDSLLTNISLIDAHRDWIPERMYPSLFIDLSLFEVLSSKDIWLSETPDVPASKSFGSMFPRLATLAKIKSKETGAEFAVCNVHLDHMNENTRIHQANVLINELKKEIGTLSLILLGDFNESPEHQIHNDICEKLGLIDYWKELKKTEETSHHSFLGDSCESGHRIDWILVPESIKCTEIYLFKKANEQGIYPSDHYPLFFSGNTHP